MGVGVSVGFGRGVEVGSTGTGVFVGGKVLVGGTVVDVLVVVG
jgi:hypothetical protein